MSEKNLKMPNHIAVILDGNGRWAKKRGFSRVEGHKEGVKNLEMLINECRDLDIKYLSLYVFSTENWKRPMFEVNNLMGLLNKYLIDKKNELIKENIRLNVVGSTTKLPEKTLNLIKEVMEVTKGNNKLVLTLCINYGSRDEIINSVKRIGTDLLNSKLKIDDIDENVFSSYLYTYDIPDPDLLIRTSGEYRLSNFLLWQCAYTEFWFTDVLWPDFKKEDLYKAIESFNNRKRRFGKVDEES